MAEEPAALEGNALSSPAAPAREGGDGPDAKVQRSRIAAAGVQAAVAAAEFAGVALTRDVVLAGLWGIFGVVSVALAYYLFRGKFNAWGTGIIVNTFGLLLALPGPNLPVVAAAAASFVVLYLVRLPFGVGAWRIEAAKQDSGARELIERRTRNPQGIRCPKCGSDGMWVADDGSAFCLSCRAGTIEVSGRQPS